MLQAFDVFDKVISARRMRCMLPKSELLIIYVYREIAGLILQFDGDCGIILLKPDIQVNPFISM